MYLFIDNVGVYIVIYHNVDFLETLIVNLA